MTMTFDEIVNAWRWSWQYDRRKHDLGPTEDEDWNEYVNSLPMSEVLWNLQIFSDNG